MMKTSNLKNKIIAFLFVLIINGFSAQNFTDKTDREIAQLFISASDNGKDKSAAKTFNKNFLAFLKKESPKIELIVDMRFANVFKELYTSDKMAAFQYMMNNDHPYKDLYSHLTAEQKEFIRTQARVVISDYSTAASVATTNTATTKDSRYNERGFYHNSFNKSDFKIYFPPATIYSNYSPLYLPRFQYSNGDVSTGFIADLDYMRTTYKGPAYASVRFTPNLPSYHQQNQISARNIVVMVFTAINHLFPTDEYIKAKQTGASYNIKTLVQPLNFISDYYLVTNGKTNTVAKAYRQAGGHELIVQIISTNRPLKFVNDLSSDEKYFLNEAVVNVSK